MLSTSTWMWKSSLCHNLNFPALAVKLTELARRQEFFLMKNTEVLAFAIQTKMRDFKIFHHREKNVCELRQSSTECTCPVVIQVCSPQLL